MAGWIHFYAQMSMNTIVSPIKVGQIG